LSRLVRHLCVSTSRFSLCISYKGTSTQRDLNSFPTRCSSDLHARCEARALRPQPARRLLAHADRKAPLGRSAPPQARVISAGAGDRKRTRLNSSHVKISYAVFCLKKKNKQIDAQKYHVTENQA